MIEDVLHHVPTTEITIPPDRQRREVAESYIEDLAASIDQRGLIHPVVLRRDKTLVVGECRVKAWRRLEELFAGDYLVGIPARYTDEIDPLELRAMELEENLQRQGLSWQDESIAFLDFYEAKSELAKDEPYDDGTPEGGVGVEYSWASMSRDLNVSDRHCRRMVAVGRKVKEGDKAILACASARAAGALIDRRAKRIIENELVTFDALEEDKPKPPPAELTDLNLDISVEGLVEAPEPEPNYSVLLADFREWIDSYAGPKFNFVHCDFPYGIGLHESSMYNTAAKDLQYDDSEDLYEELCQTLVYATDGVLSPSCHIMFWFPMSKYTATVRHFETQGFRVEPFPLVWGKSDKRGMTPDATRGPQRIYETALIMSLGDRKIIKPSVNLAWVSSEAAKKEHASQKPMGVFDIWLRMFIDEDSVVLDPTCGSGTALAAAIKLGADKVVGLDINEKCVQIAEDNCRNEHILKLRE